MIAPRLLLLTDRRQLPAGRSLVQVVAECVEVGLSHVLLRELDETELARTALVAALTEVGATVFSAHGPLYGAAGAHLAATQVVPKSLVRRGESPTDPTGTDWVAVPWGRSCHAADDVHVAAAAGASWATLSPFAATASKPGHLPIDPDHYAVASAAGIPVYALGGITPENAADAIGAGADGLAVMGAVMRAEDPAAVVRELLDVLASVAPLPAGCASAEAPW